MQKWSLFCLFVCFVCLTPFHLQADTVKKVLIVQSYGKNSPTAMAQEEGIRAVLSQSGLNLQIKTFYMDTKKVHTTHTAIAKRGTEIRKEILKWHPDVVIVVDDNACQEVMLKMVDTSYKFVFSGMNMPPEVYNEKVHFMDSRKRPGHNITGVVEKLYIVASINIAKEMLPNLKMAFLFVSTSPTGQAVKEAALYELKRESSSVPLEIKTADTLEVYQHCLQALNKRYTASQAVILPLIERLQDNEQVWNILEIVDFTLKHNHLPEIGGPVALVRAGYLGTAAVDFKEMGRQAGEKAVLILKGYSPATIPIEDTRGYEIAINFKRARKLGIKIPFAFLLSADLILGGEEF